MKYLNIKTIRNVLLSLATLFVLSGKVNSEPLSKAQIFFNSFPTNIQNAKIEKFPTPGAKHCIIHFKQSHYTNDMTNQTILNKINHKQKNIYKILKDLADKKYIKNVRIEGIEENPQEFLEDIVKRDYMRIKRLTGKEYVGGGAKKLVLEKKIIPKPGETFKGAYNGRLSEKLKLKGKKHIKYVLDDREDEVLKLITNDNEPFSVVVYGAAHEWGGKNSCGSNYNPENVLSDKDNIYEWNKKHPNKKFSHIRITPKTNSDYSK